MGIRWEVKYDRLWHTRGNVYLELQALDASQADNTSFWPASTGKHYVIATRRYARP